VNYKSTITACSTNTWRTFISNVQNSSTYPRMTYNTEMIGNLALLDAFHKLKDDWDGNDAPGFCDKAALIKFCKEVIINLGYQQPNIYPTSRGSIQLEYEKDNGEYLEFEIFEEERIIGFQICSNQEEINVEIRSIEELKKKVMAF